VAGSKGFPGQSVYNASKAAVRSFARSWTTDLKERGIRVNVVSPSGTETRPMRNYLDARPGVEEMLKQMEPLGRLGQADEIARAVTRTEEEEAHLKHACLSPPNSTPGLLLREVLLERIHRSAPTLRHAGVRGVEDGFLGFTRVQRAPLKTH
jgi:NADPH-dependent 2,4-dienoyl-CoA reductase/sulfur reductase-like enzyme